MMAVRSRVITSGVLVAISFLLASVGTSTWAASGVDVSTKSLPVGFHPAQEVTETPTAEIEGFFEADGRSLHLSCLGSGTPAIILETGEGGTVREFHRLQAKLSELTTTCAYERANNGRSDRAPVPRTAADITSDLNALLEAAHVPGPYLLVGTSAGGMLEQLYARLYPEQVVGVLALNPVPPAGPWLDAVREVFTADEYTGETAYFEGDNGESLDYQTSSEQLAEAPSPPEVPFELLISTALQCEGDQICLKSYDIYERVMADLAAEWPCGHVSQIEALHDIPNDAPDAVMDLVQQMLTSPVDSGSACPSIELTDEPQS